MPRYQAAFERWAARCAPGPTLIECRTYGHEGHAEGMGDFTYRTRAEQRVEIPVPNRDLRLNQEPLATPEEPKSLDSDLIQQVNPTAKPRPAPVYRLTHPYLR